jgi:hypothetical protein
VGGPREGRDHGGGPATEAEAAAGAFSVSGKSTVLTISNPLFWQVNSAISQQENGKAGRALTRQYSQAKPGAFRSEIERFPCLMCISEELYFTAARYGINNSINATYPHIWRYKLRIAF